MLNRFYDLWRYGRVATLIAAGLIVLCGTIKSYSYSLEIEYTGPGSEAERLDRDYQDRENEKSFDRCSKGEGSDRDQERSRDWERDHGV